MAADLPQVNKDARLARLVVVLEMFRRQNRCCVRCLQIIQMVREGGNMFLELPLYSMNNGMHKHATICMTTEHDD